MNPKALRPSPLEAFNAAAVVAAELGWSSNGVVLADPPGVGSRVSEEDEEDPLPVLDVLLLFIRTITDAAVCKGNH